MSICAAAATFDKIGTYILNVREGLKTKYAVDAMCRQKNGEEVVVVASAGRGGNFSIRGGPSATEASGAQGVVLVAAAAALAWSLPAMAQTSSSAPSSSASGRLDCSALPPVLARDGADWRRPARVFRASPRPAADVAVSLRERVSLTLGNAAQTPLVVQPGSSERAAEDGYRGFVALRTGKSGDYRVSLDDRAWIEVIAQGVAQPSVVTFSDKRLACFGVVKNLTFALRADTVYFIQISRASRPGIGLLVSPPWE